jgi:drug/metabolite transporter (DMT)-like permease
MLPSLVLIGAGIACVNQAELAQQPSHTDLARHAQGAALAVVAVACWTWYPLRNADWLRAHRERSPRAWATAQGLATLPMALLGYAAFWAWNAHSAAPFAMPWGPQPLKFAGLMLAIGLLASWAGTLCWNEASQRLPATRVAPLIVFETLAALAYAFVLRGEWPGPGIAAGVALLVAGVVLALRVKPLPRGAPAPQP